MKIFLNENRFNITKDKVPFEFNLSESDKNNPKMKKIFKNWL